MSVPVAQPSYVALAGNLDPVGDGNVAPPGRLGTGSSITTKYLRGDSTWAVIPPAVVTAVTSGNGLTLTSGTLAFSGAGYDTAGAAAAVQTNLNSLISSNLTGTIGNFAGFLFAGGGLISDSGFSAASFDVSGAAATVQTNLNTHTAATGTAVHGLGTASTLTAGVANGAATLDSGGHLTAAQIPTSLVGALQYQGTWNATTNSPTIVSSTGTKGQYYKVATAGTTTIDTINQWKIGDTIVFDGTVWDKIDGIANEVVTVFGRFGAVVGVLGDYGLSTGSTGADLSATGGTGQFVKQVTSGGALTVATIGTADLGSGTANSTTYLRGDLTWATVSAVTTGNLTEATSSILTITGGTGAVVGIGTTIQVKQASGSQNGFLASADWTTFNGKISANQTIILSGDATGSGTTTITVSVAAINGATLGSTTATSGNVLIGSGTAWVTKTVSGDATLASTGAITIASHAITYAKLQQASTVTLLGNSTGGTANVQEITLGSGLAFSGTTLTASGSSGTVTSVAAAGPTGIFTWSAAVTGSGTLTATLATQTANTVFAGPTTGAAAAPAFRSLVSADIPNNAANTSGTAASLSISGQTGLLTVTGLASTNRAKTVRDAADTILEQGGGTYTPTGTWVWTSATVTWPTFNQNTSGSAGSVAAANITGTTLASGVTASSLTSFGATPTITAPVITFSVSASVSAAGTTQGGATALTSDVNDVTVVASGAGVALPTATVGRRSIVINKGANALLIYPATSGFIDALAINTAISLPVGGLMEFEATTATQWYSSANYATNAASLTGVLGSANGGTGFNNGSATIAIVGNVTLAGAFTMSGAFSFTGTVTGATSVTFPTSGTLVNTAVTTLSSLASVGTLTGGATGAGFTIALTTSTVTGLLTGTNGGTGVNNGSSTFTIGGNVAFSGSFTCTQTLVKNSSYTMPTTGTVEAKGYQTLSISGAAAAIDSQLGGDCRLVLSHTGSTTLSNPTNAYDGQVYNVLLIQDSTGGCAMTFGTNYVFSTSLPSPTITGGLSTAANAVDMISFKYDSNISKWRVTGFLAGWSA